jgi:signal transduction histidine kinase
MPDMALDTMAPASTKDACVQLLDALGTGVLLVDASERIRVANRRAVEILGVPYESLVGVPLTKFLPSIAQLQALSTSADERPSVSIRQRDGTQVRAGFTLTVADTSASGSSHAIAFQDITPLVRLQEERDRLLQLATVGEVMPSVLHEAKNPLSAAITALEVLIEESTDARLQHDLHAVLVEVRRAVLTLDGLGSAGLDPTAPVPHAIDHAVREVASVLASRAQLLGMRLVTEVADMPLLPFEPSVVRAVVFNLANNALQACRPGDTVTIEARLVGPRVEIAVRDTGAGMEPAVLARCTELFFSTKRSGSGIGLALCKEVAERAGGELFVSSSVGVGTTVRLSLPMAAPRLAMPTPAMPILRPRL